MPALLTLGNHHLSLQAHIVLFFVPVFLFTETNYSPTLPFRLVDSTDPNTFLSEQGNQSWLISAKPLMAYDSSTQERLKCLPDMNCISKRHSIIYPGGDLMSCLLHPVQIF